MQAIQVNEYGEREQLALNTIDVPTPGPSEVRVKISFAGINFIDIYMRRGMYANNRAYATTLPLTIGMEGSGTVDAFGPDVVGLEVGDQVAYCLSPGSYAEYAIVPAWKLARVPKGIDLDVACALMLQGGTAHYLTHSLYKLSATDTCLIHAGSGGVGQLLIQIAKTLGATVITTVGSEAKAKTARGRGADHVILYEQQDFKEEVRQITNGEGVDVVYESVGQATFERSIYSLKHRGTCVLFGASSGPVTSLNPQMLADAGSIFLTRPNLADYMANADEIAGRTNDLFAMTANGILSTEISQTFPLADAADAHAALEGRGTTGKILLSVD